MNTTPLSTPSLAARLIALARLPIGWIEHLQPLAQLAARLYIAGVFFRSGRTKIADWDTTLALFENEYHVPLLPPELAAWMGTGGELGLSVLLALGLAGRFSAAGLSILNVVAVLSLAEINEAALLGHQFWGSLLLALLLWGPGKLSLDNLVLRWLGLPPRHRS